MLAIHFFGGPEPSPGEGFYEEKEESDGHQTVRGIGYRFALRVVYGLQ